LRGCAERHRPPPNLARPALALPPSPAAPRSRTPSRWHECATACSPSHAPRAHAFAPCPPPPSCPLALPRVRPSPAPFQAL
jgi:hypothetical protein